MNGAELQKRLIQRIKERLPAHLSLADEFASLLGVSTDSAYRRIRGEKLMDIGEVQLMCRHYGLSFDAAMGQSYGSYLFDGRFAEEGDFNFAMWLASLNMQLESALQGKPPVFIFQSKDVPLFHHFQLPELTRFKLFFWRKTILQQSGPELDRLQLTEGDEALVASARKVFLTYQRLPSTEIQNAESLNSTLRQINFYREMGLFTKESDAQLLFDQVLLLLDRLEAQAEAGVKFAMGEEAEHGNAAFRLYLNEVLLGDNAIYMDNGHVQTVFLNHTGINYIGTTDEAFCKHTLRSLENIMKRSTLISGTGEKERKRFFRAMREEVGRRRM